ncbi:MAG: hypothetical protein ABWZ88_04855 [Variovorax sp.]
MNNELELLVDEPIPGHFYWTIVCRESPDDEPEVVDYGRGPVPTHEAAEAAGIYAMRLREEVEAKVERRKFFRQFRAESYAETSRGGLS